MIRKVGGGGGEGGLWDVWEGHTTKLFGRTIDRRNLCVDENFQRLQQRVEKGVCGAHEGLDNFEPVIDTPA